MNDHSYLEEPLSTLCNSDTYTTCCNVRKQIYHGELSENTTHNVSNYPNPVRTRKPIYDTKPFTYHGRATNARRAGHRVHTAAQPPRACQSLPLPPASTVPRGASGASRGSDNLANGGGHAPISQPLASLQFSRIFASSGSSSSTTTSVIKGTAIINSSRTSFAALSAASCLLSRWSGSCACRRIRSYFLLRQTTKEYAVGRPECAKESVQTRHFCRRLGIAYGLTHRYKRGHCGCARGKGMQTCPFPARRAASAAVRDDSPSSTV